MPRAHEGVAPSLAPCRHPAVWSRIAIPPQTPSNSRPPAMVRADARARAPRDIVIPCPAEPHLFPTSGVRHRFPRQRPNRGCRTREPVRATSFIRSMEWPRTISISMTSCSWRTHMDTGRTTSSRSRTDQRPGSTVCHCLDGSSETNSCTSVASTRAERLEGEVFGVIAGNWVSGQKSFTCSLRPAVVRRCPSACCRRSRRPLRSPTRSHVPISSQFSMLSSWTASGQKPPHCSNAGCLLFTAGPAQRSSHAPFLS